MQDFYRKVINQFTGILTAVADFLLIQKLKNKNLILIIELLITIQAFFTDVLLIQLNCLILTRS